MVDETYMKRALMLAKKGRTSPNPMVGAVVVRETVIVGEGYHHRAGERHAEVLALEQASDKAKGADLYVTLEPCCHHGKTPPCTDAVLRSGVKRVIAAMLDPNPLVAGKGAACLREAGIEVHVGLLEPEAKELNKAYIKRITTGMPYVLWKSAMTLDGKTATQTGDSRWISGEPARQEVQRLRMKYDADMVGIGTVLADDPELVVHGYPGAPNPVRVVVDAKASIPLNALVLDSRAKTIVAVGQDVPESKVEDLKATGAEVVAVPSSEGWINLPALMTELGNQGINSVLLEGGGELVASMLRDGLIDKGLIFIAPKIVGGRDAKTPVEGDGVNLMSEALEVSKPKIRNFKDDVALEFDFAHSTRKLIRDEHLAEELFPARV